MAVASKTSTPALSTAAKVDPSSAIKLPPPTPRELKPGLQHDKHRQSFLRRQSFSKGKDPQFDYEDDDKPSSDPARLDDFGDAGEAANILATFGTIGKERGSEGGKSMLKSDIATRSTNEQDEVEVEHQGTGEAIEPSSKKRAAGGAKRGRPPPNAAGGTNRGRPPKKTRGSISTTPSTSGSRKSARLSGSGSGTSASRTRGAPAMRANAEGRTTERNREQSASSLRKSRLESRQNKKNADDAERAALLQELGVEAEPAPRVPPPRRRALKASDITWVLHESGKKYEEDGKATFYIDKDPKEPDVFRTGISAQFDKRASTHHTQYFNNHYYKLITIGGRISTETLRSIETAMQFYGHLKGWKELGDGTEILRDHLVYSEKNVGEIVKLVVRLVNDPNAVIEVGSASITVNKKSVHHYSKHSDWRPFAEARWPGLAIGWGGGE